MEKQFCSVSGVEAPLDYPLASIAQISKPVKSGILELTTKLRESAIVPAIPFHKINAADIIQSISSLPLVSIGTDTTSVINAEEALEMPPIVPLELGTSLVTEIDQVPSPIDLESAGKISIEEIARNHDRRKIFQKIGEQEFEDVVFTPKQRSKKSSNKLPNGTDSNKSMSQSLDGATTRASLLTLSSENCFSMKKSDRDLETIQKDVECKEKLLADVLNFDLSEYMTSSRIQEPEVAESNGIAEDRVISDEIKNGVDQDSDLDDEPPVTETESIDDEDESYKTEIDKLREMGECSKQLLLSRKEDESCLGKNKDSVDIGIEPCTMDSDKVTEEQFNVLSKDFISSANYDDNEDWIFLDLE